MALDAGYPASRAICSDDQAALTFGMISSTNWLRSSKVFINERLANFLSNEHWHTHKVSYGRTTF
jgi:hypothetical protein